MNKEESKIVFRIIDLNSNKAVGSFTRSYYDKYDFESREKAYNANCHGLFKDKAKYKITKYQVTYKLIDDV